MSLQRVFLLAFFVLLTGFPIGSAPLAQEKQVFEVTQLADGIYELSTDGGGYKIKVIASVGNDGVLLVDTGEKNTGKELQAALQTLVRKQASEKSGEKPGSPAAQSPGGASGPSAAFSPRIIINTHSHIEHTGGNIAFGKGPLVIGHDNLRTTLRSGEFLFDEFPDEAIPQVTFNDSMSLHFNGDDIKLIAFTGAHDNSDIIVWFTRSKIVCVGALCNGLHFPSVDHETGDVTQYPEVVARVIATLPEDVKIIPGHGEDCSMADFRTFHSMLVKTSALVNGQLAGGKDVARLKAEDVLKNWESFECSYVNRNQWIDYLAKAFSGKAKADQSKRRLFEPMYYALKEKGADAAIEQYYDMKARKSGTYLFDEATPVYIAYKLFENGKFEPSLKFFELTLSEYPNGRYAALCYDYIAQIHDQAGATQLAIKNYRKSLALDPDNPKAAERLRELETRSDAGKD